MQRFATALAVVFLALPAFAADRDVQIRSVDFTAGIVELHNFGAVDESLSGWRFCTHDENQTRRYSDSGGLNGVTVEAGTSYFIHYNNDAPGGDPDRVDRSTLEGAFGSFATPLDNGAYAMGLYINSGFGVGSNLADHLQWSIDGVDNASADERSDEAQSGGVWTDQSAWIPTAADTILIRLKDASAGLTLHGPGDYEALNSLVTVPGAVPDGASVPGAPLVLDKAADDEVTLTWEASCSTAGSDYAIYEGPIGDVADVVSLICSTGGSTSSTFLPPLESVFFIVVPNTGSDEGSYGRDSLGVERLPAAVPCHPAAPPECPAPGTRRPR